MDRFKLKTPHFFVWGLLFLLIISISFVSCGSEIATWEQDGFKVSYDSTLFTVDESDSEFLSLSRSDDDGDIIVLISGFNPFALEQEKIDYFDSAQVAFEDEFAKVTNISKEDNLQYGVHDRRVSVSGRYPGFEGVTMGFLRVMISDETLLHMSVVGNSKTMMSNMEAIQELLNSAEITK